MTHARSVIVKLASLLSTIKLNVTTSNDKLLVYGFLYRDKSNTSKERMDFIKKVGPFVLGKYDINHTKGEKLDRNETVLRARAGLFRSHGQSLNILVKHIRHLGDEYLEIGDHLEMLRDLLLNSATIMNKKHQYQDRETIMSQINLLSSLLIKAELRLDGLTPDQKLFQDKQTIAAVLDGLSSNQQSSQDKKETANTVSYFSNLLQPCQFFSDVSLRYTTSAFLKRTEINDFKNDDEKDAGDTLKRQRLI